MFYSAPMRDDEGKVIKLGKVLALERVEEETLVSVAKLWILL